MSALRDLLESRRVVVACGAGGVGKTTTSAALALAGARLGRRTLVLTIDPSRRLAETLGVSRNAPEPSRVGDDRVAGTGGRLDAWMLDPRAVADAAVRKLARDGGEAERFLDNKIYQAVSRMVAGMQEYAAMKSLHRFREEKAYDLIVLDTPPSRHALDFLDSPERVARFFDTRIFKLFIPMSGPKGGPQGGPKKREGFFARAASGLVHKTLSGAFGAELASELTGFMGSFSGLLSTLNQDMASAARGLRDPAETSFLAVATPERAALDEARHFEAEAARRGLPFGGIILNRSRAERLAWKLPDTSLPEAFRRLAEKELTDARADAEQARGGSFVASFPARAGDGPELLDGLARLALA